MEHLDDKDLDNKGQKRSAADADLTSKVHSTNAWETVELGGDLDRKNKFLRLMGASKKEHHGRFVIGDQDPDKERKADSSGHLVEGLEEQFRHGIEYKKSSGYKGHKGLGFTEDVPKQEVDNSEKEGQSEAQAASSESTESEGHKKPSEPDLTSKVHSSNDWEHAELGDSGRKNKFLRLMGATKKEHSGRFVIGDQDGSKDRKADSTGHLNENLEDQYKHCIEYKKSSGFKGHKGFGFSAEDPNSAENTASQSEVDSTTQPSQCAEEEGTCPSQRGGDAYSSHEPVTPDQSDNSAAAKYKKLSFVKASNS